MFTTEFLVLKVWCVIFGVGWVGAGGWGMCAGKCITAPHKLCKLWVLFNMYLFILRVFSTIVPWVLRYAVCFKICSMSTLMWYMFKYMFSHTFIWWGTINKVILNLYIVLVYSIFDFDFKFSWYSTLWAHWVQCYTRPRAITIVIILTRKSTYLWGGLTKMEAELSRKSAIRKTGDLTAGKAHEAFFWPTVALIEGSI